VNIKKPLREDVILANRALKFAEEIVKRKKPSLLVLDEVNIAVRFKLLKISDILNFLKKCPKNLLVVLTGRYAPGELLRIADLVIEFRNLKEPKVLKPARTGIEY
jgi:cob(I)alamin adenosyltransferase